MTQWGTATLTYDANGNMLSTGTDGYTWDARNHLVSTLSGASLKYDPFGRRASKTVSGATTNFLYDGLNPVQELSGTTPTANLLTGGLDEFFTRADSAGARNFLTDPLGSTLALAGSTGALQTQYTYEPFGSASVSGATSANPYQFTARENDGTGLYFYRARYYSPTFERFITEDPLDFGVAANPYTYAANDPMNWFDPLGLRPGDRYKTLDCAGFHAVWDINWTSIHQNIEYAGWLFRSPDGTYSYTPPRTLHDPFGSDPGPAPAGKAGEYHTHAAYVGPTDENFSPADEDFLDRNNVPGYLGTPHGSIKKYTPIPGHPRQGPVRVLDPKRCRQCQ